jgi:hypothetical protein
MTSLRLGNFTFARGEVPEGIGFGSSQQLHVHTLAGGARVIDAMGAVPLKQEWSGWFIGPQALSRARILKRMTEVGQPLALRYGEFAYTVVIASFSAEFRAGPNLPYSIVLEVVRDHGAAGPHAGGSGLAQLLAQDLAGAAANCAAIGDSGLIAAVSAVGAVVTASGGTELTAGEIQALLPVIAVVQAQVAALNVVASAQISGLGVLSSAGSSGDPVGPEALSQFGAGLVAAAVATQRSFRLGATTQLLGRVTGNLAAAGGNAGGGTTLTTGSTDLYHVAAAAYGDARDWARIAQTNRLTDPFLSGISQLTIPPAAVSAMGVLDA